VKPDTDLYDKNPPFTWSVAYN